MYNYEGNEPQKIVVKQICILHKRFKLTNNNLNIELKVLFKTL